jgi:hypothetical protein
MRKLLFNFFLIISTSTLFAQKWQMKSGASDFDGNYTSAYLTGVANNSDYRRPILVINSYADYGVNFYITDFGYAGCSNADIKFVFDGKKVFCANFEISRDKEAAIFSSFNNYLKEKDYCSYIEQSIYQVLKEAKSSKRLTVRIENDCFSDDFYFDLTGTSGILDKVLGKGFVERRIAKEEAEYRNAANADSVYRFLQSARPDLDVNEDLFKRMSFLYSYQTNYINLYYRTSIEDLAFFYSLTNTFTTKEDLRFISRDNEIYSIQIEDIKGDGSDSVLLIPYGYFVNIDNNRIFPQLSAKQKLIEDYIAENSSFRNLSALRLMDIDSFEIVRKNLNVDEILNICGSVKRNGNRYMLKPSKDNKLDGEFIEVNFLSRELTVLSVLPYLYESLEGRIYRLEQEAIRNKKVQDSIKVWNEIPDPNLPVYDWFEVTEKPTLPGYKFPHYAVQDRIKEGINDFGSKKLKREIIDVLFTVEIDYYGKITLNSIDGLDERLKKELMVIISSLKSLSSPRYNGKICRTQLSMKFSELKVW